MPKVTVIPARSTINQSFGIKPKSRRVAGYARVSTDLEAQDTSFDAQVSYYTEYINNHEGWSFVKIYTDDGISGTGTSKRLGFQQMIADALDGKIDLIVTKSVSRFARNTVDSITIIRQLKEKGVEVFFEKENIWTLDSKGELLLTIMSSLAQEESRSLSENVKWGKRKAFADGRVTLQVDKILGYRKNSDGEIYIDETEAETVRFIFNSYLAGMNIKAIADTLTDKGVKTAKGNSVWYYSSVKGILQNEKYIGNALLQKSYTVDFLTHRKKVNTGELPQYYVEGNHPAIISKDVFDVAQAMLADKKASGRKLSKGLLFSGRITCECCGTSFVHRVWTNGKYRYEGWECRKKYSNVPKCSSPILRPAEIESAIITAINQIVVNKSSVISRLEETLNSAFNSEQLNILKIEAENKVKSLSERLNEMDKQNSIKIQNQEEYNLLYGQVASMLDSAKAELDSICSQIISDGAKLAKIRMFIKDLKKQHEVISSFSPELFNLLVDGMTIGEDPILNVNFKDGSTISVNLR